MSFTTEQVQRLIKAIFAEPTEEELEACAAEVEKEIDAMTDEEVTAYLIAEGFDIDELHRKFKERIDKLKADLATEPIPPESSPSERWAEWRE